MVNGNWNTAEQWTPTGVPNNGSPTEASHYDAVISATGSPYTVTLNSGITVDSLLLDSANATVNHTSGTLDLTNGLILNSGTYQLNGGTIRGGTISGTGGQITFQPQGTFDGVTIARDLTFSTGNFADAWIDIRNGLTLSNSVISLTGARFNHEHVDLRLQGSQTIDGNGTIRAIGPTNNRVFAVGGTVTLGSNIVAEAVGNSQLLLGTANSGLVNNGLIWARDGGYVSLEAANWFNAGTIQVSPGSTMVLRGSTTTAGFNNVRNLGGTLRLEMRVDNTGSVFDFSRITGPYEFSHATIVGGSITGASAVTLSPLTLSGNPTLDGVTIDVNLIVPSNTLGLRNNVTLNNRRIDLREGAAIELFTPQTLGGTGEILATVLPDSSGSAATIRGNGYTIGSGITIRSGLPRPNDPLAIVIEGDQWTNQGTIVSNHGTLTLRGSNWRNAGTVRVTGGEVSLEGTYTHASLDGLTISNAQGTLRGQMQNAGNTLRVGGTAPDWIVSAVIDGGRLEAAPGHIIRADRIGLRGVTLSGQLQDVSPSYEGNIVLDNATIIVAGSGAEPAMLPTGPATISGIGRIVLNSSSPYSGRLGLPSDAPVVPAGVIVEVGTGSGRIHGNNAEAWSNDGELRAAGSGKQLTLSGGPVTNRGQINALSGATVRSEVPLTNAGQINVQRGTVNTTQSFTQQPAGELIVEIAGSRPGIDYGVFDGDGLTTLAGTLRVVLPSRYSPRVGSRFDILNWGTRVGEFESIVLPSLPFGRTWDSSALYSLGELRVNGTPPIVSTIALSGFNEPPLNAGTFTPSAAQVELGFATSSSSNGGQSPTASVQLVGTNRVFSHRSVNATTTFNAVDLTLWLEATVSLDVQVANTAYESGDFLRVYITNGVQSVDLFNQQGTNSTDGLDNLATAGFRTYSADIPFDWTTASLVIASSSNSSAAAERFDFDNIRITGVAVPEPHSMAIALAGLLFVVLRRWFRSTAMSSLFQIVTNCGLLAAALTSSTNAVYAVELRSGDLLVIDGGFDAVVQIDPITGNRAFISGRHTGTVGDGPLWENIRGLEWEPEGTILASDDPNIYRVDPITGGRSILSGTSRGTGPTLEDAEDLALSPDGELFVLKQTGLINTNSILRVDRFTGNRSEVSSQTVGSGPFFNSVRGIVHDGSNGIYVAANSDVFFVDTVTGNRSIVSSLTIGSGPEMRSLSDITLLDESTLLIAGRMVHGITVYPSVFTIDIPTGNRTLISNDTRGGGPILRSADGVAVSNDGQMFVSDRLARALIAVDLATGDRTVFSSGDNSSHGMHGEGPDVSNLTRLEVARDVLQQQAVVPYGSSWKYLDTGVVIGGNWRGLAFNDSSWLTGTAEFGYGDGDESTVVNCGPSAPACNTSNRASTHFRKVVTIDDITAFSGYIGHVLRDDAAAVYINGVEVFRDPSLPANSASTVFVNTASDENEVATFLIDPALFVEGANIIAVQVHQATATSSDLSFDFHLVGLATPVPEPTASILVVSALGTIPMVRAWRR